MPDMLLHIMPLIILRIIYLSAQRQRMSYAFCYKSTRIVPCIASKMVTDGAMMRMSLK